MDKPIASVYVVNRADQRRNILILGFIALYSGLFISPVTWSHDILILKEASAPFQDKILRSIIKNIEISNKNIVIDSQDIESITRKQIILKSPDLIVTLGSKAARNQDTGTFPTLHALIPESLYSSLSNCNDGNCIGRKPIYGLYLNQPVKRQLNLLRLLLPGLNSPGLLSSSYSADKAAEFVDEAKKLNLNMHVELVDSEQQLHRSLNKLLKNIDVFIALPDPLIHTRQSIPHLLLTTYRYNIPVLGFSQAYVNAGAVAAIYSSPEQISLQIVDLIKKLTSDTPPPSGNYPNKDFEVAINRSVARSLGLNFPDEQTLKSKLMQLEQ